jgi:hypothetical protein
LLPLHPPEAVQELALVLTQLSVETLPLVTEVGLALRDTVGAGGALTVTITDWFALPPAPTHVSV